MGSNTEGIDVRSVGNSVVLKQTALIEAFNLKAAIEYTMRNHAASKEALTDMPPRSEARPAPPRRPHRDGKLFICVMTPQRLVVLRGCTRFVASRELDGCTEGSGGFQACGARAAEREAA